MLAYVFWHWPRPDAALPVYEAAQRRFHAALTAAPSPGFVRSRSAGLMGAPWAAQGDAAYEDWYLMEDAAALDPLNQAAVSAPRQASHDAAAGLAAGGVAGLYTVRGGAPLVMPAYATWFAKPAGMAYTDLDAALLGAVTAGACLWMRYMVLGPAPEFCLQTLGPVQLPPRFNGRTIELRPVWP